MTCKLLGNKIENRASSPVATAGAEGENCGLARSSNLDGERGMDLKLF